MKNTNALPLNWARIDTVLLDMDGTLLDLHFDNHFWLKHVPRRYAEQHGLSYDAAHERLLRRYSEVKGRLDWYCVDFWSRELDLDIETLKRELAGKIAIRPEVEPFLHALNAAGKRVVLVTNAHPASLDLKMETTGLHSHFDRIINAHDIGRAKESPGFWALLQQHEPYDPARSLLIDDNFEVLASARDYGIGFCLGIHQPDSQSPPVSSTHFTVIKCFSELLPVA